MDNDKPALLPCDEICAVQREIDASQMAIETQVDNVRWIANNRKMGQTPKGELGTAANLLTSIRQRLVMVYDRLELLKLALRDTRPAPAAPWVAIVTADDLPKEIGEYLVTTQYGDVAVVRWVRNGWVTMRSQSDFIAYMPLPEPYRPAIEDEVKI